MQYDFLKARGIFVVKGMTRGAPLRMILLFCGPLVLGNLFQQFYNMADTLIVGRFVGVDALAAVGSTSSLNFLVIGFATGVCSGFSIPVAQLFGAGDYPRMRRCAANAVFLGAVITALLTGITVACAGPVLRLMSTPEDIFQDAYTYIVIIFAGIPATMLYNLLSGFLRALGDSRTPLFFLVTAALLNVVLDLVFILCFGAGAAGAAWATVISQGVSGLLCFWFILRRVPLLRLAREAWRRDVPEQRRLLTMGIPMALQFSITAVGTILIQAAVNALGSGVVAAVTAGNKVQNLFMSPMETMGITMATYCGQNLGAERVDRIRAGIRCSLAVVMGYCLLAWGATTLWASPVSRLFLTGENVDTLVAQSAQFLVINSWFFPFLGVLFVLRNSIQGLGFGLPAMLAGVFELAARSAVAFCLVGPLGYLAICLANPAAWIAAAVLLAVVYFRQIRLLEAKYPSPARDLPG